MVGLDGIELNGTNLLHPVNQLIIDFVPMPLPIERRLYLPPFPPLRNYFISMLAKASSIAHCITGE
jgi:hypothetical protein